MASSCGSFHEEALRRQRVIDRKRAALYRLATLEEENERLRIEQAKADEMAKQQRHQAKMRELENHLNAAKGSTSRNVTSAGHFSRVATHPHLVNPRREFMRPTTVMGIPTSAYETIKGKEKILRDHNLYQAHPAVLWRARSEAHC